MPPRRSDCVATAAKQRAGAFPELPLECVERIFSLLPVNDLLRCAMVSRGWRGTAAMPALWRRLDVSPTNGVGRVTPALLRAALARAGAALGVLDVPNDMDTNDLCAALGAASGLGELHLGKLRARSIASVAAVLAAAPQLHQLHCGVACAPTDAVAVLDGRPPFAPLRLHALHLISRGRVPRGDEALPPELALALGDARLQPGLARLTLTAEEGMSRPGVWDAFADAVVARRLTHLTFISCGPPPHAAPVLSRMLRDGGITNLEYVNSMGIRFEDHAAVVGHALCVNSLLTTLTFRHFMGSAADVVPAVLRSLVGHRSLRRLDVGFSRLSFHGVAAVGPALAALLAADAPALLQLSVMSCVMSCNFGEAVLGLLCDALPRNHHLETLDMRGNPVPAGFMRARLLPAVRANTGLRNLLVSSSRGLSRDDEVAVQQAQRIVAER